MHFYDGTIPFDYYVNGVTRITFQDGKNVEKLLRSDDMHCFGGEEEFDLIMNGDFNAFNRSDCALRYTEIFRWSWESWHAAVGTQIGKIYLNAINVMNVGARTNGFFFIFT